MRLEVGSLVARKVALCALVRFLPTVNERVDLQVGIRDERLVTLWAIILLDPTVC